MNDVDARAQARGDLNAMLRDFIDHRTSAGDLRTRLGTLSRTSLSDNLVTQVHVLEELAEQVASGERDDEELQTLAITLTAPGAE